MQLPDDYLRKEGFEILQKVPHERFLAFLKKIKWAYSGWQTGYLMILGIGIIGVCLWIKQSTSDYFFVFSFALLGIFLIVPILWIHEVIHYWTFKIMGAKNVRIDYNLQKLYFLTLADHFMITKDQWIKIALLPSILITVIGLCTIYYLSELWQIALGTALVLHWTSCRADFKIIYYLQKQKLPIKTYTDFRQNITYIYHQNQGRKK